jgi:CBS domain-containing protein/ribosome-associated translation inhibitor RaiA
MSLVSEIVIEPPILLKPSMRIGEVIPRMSELKIREAPVVDDNEVLVGVLSYRAILSKGVGRDTKVSTAMDPPYALKEDNSIDEAIARIVQWKARDIPIIDDSEKVVGYINRVMLLKYLVDKGIIPNDIVDNVMHSPAITIQEWESIARARWAMLRNGISRLPVVDRYERVVGVITLSDIVERLFRIKLSRRKGYEWIQSEESFLAAPVSDFMSTPAVTVPLGIKLIEAAKTMLDKGVAGAPVVTGDERVVGVLSGIDVLKKYLETSVALQPLEAKISTVGEIDEITRVSVERIINNYLSSFTKYVNVIDFKLAVKELGKSEESRGKDVRRGFEVSARIVTDEGSFATKSMCWDLPTCVREVMNIIEKRIRKHIEKKTVAKPGYKRTTE